MAADVSTATVASQPAPFHRHAYKKSAQFTPIGSGANTPNLSPTSPRNTSHLQNHPHYVPQIRPPKNPIYTPAALRKTEKPLRQSPPKADSVVESPNSSWGSGNGFAQSTTNDGASILRVGTEDLNSIYGDGPLSPVTGPITKNHWQPDSSTSVCTASACQAPFGFFNRRHHCRKCGGIFCWQHSQQRVKLNELALFHVEGEWQRACDRCHTQYREWEQLRTSRQNSDSSASTSAVQIEAPKSTKRPENNRIGSLATSIQNTWNWSTF